MENPTQADEGAQVYWLNCLPCHADRGQGLTDEWRAQYPPEDQNCWNVGCHGDRPDANGFTLPPTAPALVGPGTLERSVTAADLYALIRRAMPYQAPGSLNPDAYWALTAFMLRRHGRPDLALPIEDEAEAQMISIHPATANVTPAPPSRTGEGLRYGRLGLAALCLLSVGAVLAAWRRGLLRTGT